MDEAADIATRTQRFNEAARKYTPPSPIRHAKLAPFKDGIVELRQKGASLRLIRELLATAAVAVGTDTIARFIAEVNSDPIPQRVAKRSCRQRATASRPIRTSTAPVPSVPATPPQSTAPASSPSAEQPQSDAPTERSRIRGPRIADPRSL
jgi:hypothetical protein